MKLTSVYRPLLEDNNYMRDSQKLTKVLHKQSVWNSFVQEESVNRHWSVGFIKFVKI